MENKNKDRLEASQGFHLCGEIHHRRVSTPARIKLHLLPFSKPTVSLMMGVGRCAIRNSYDLVPTFKEIMVRCSKDNPISS